MKPVKLIPPYPGNRPRASVKRKSRRGVVIGAAVFAAAGTGVLLTPVFLKETIVYQQSHTATAASAPDQFPVTVNPHTKTIAQNDAVDKYLDSPDSPLQAAAASSGISFSRIFTWVATTIGNAPIYRSVAAADARFVTIDPGMRKEQVAAAFGAQLGWTSAQVKQFETASPYAALPLPEGSYQAGVYLVTPGTLPSQAQEQVNDRFTEDVLSHYGTTTAQIVPLNEALTVASLIERETGGPDDMRLISGIIWNRLFIGMKLQIDATLQYAKVNAAKKSSWWPAVLPDDKKIVSAYNTYIHAGLPPTPIATPSIAAVLAALNPVETDCLFYFHDKLGQIHCSDDYAQHVALLKKYYGQGK